MIRAGARTRLEDGGLGVSRFDLECGRHSKEDTTALVRRWGHDRALPADTVEDLCVLTCAALAPGPRFEPSSVCVLLRWDDLDHVRVDVQWHGLGGSTPDDVADEAMRGSGEVMDTLAVRWGLMRSSTPGQWMIVDTRSTRPVVSPPR